MEEKNILIDPRLAKAMTVAYDKRKKKIGRIIAGVKEDTSYVYIPMKRLKEYVDKYKNAVGVRVYFGVIDDYTINSKKFPCKKVHKKHTTVILKATNDIHKKYSQIEPLIAIPSIDTINTDYGPMDDFGICPPPLNEGGKCNTIDES